MRAARTPRRKGALWRCRGFVCAAVGSRAGLGAGPSALRVLSSDPLRGPGVCVYAPLGFGSWGRSDRLQSGRGPPPRCSCSPGLGPAGSFPRPHGQDPGRAPAPSRRLASLLLREVLTRSFGRVTDSAVSLSPQHRHSVSALRPPRCRSLPTVTTSHGRVSALDPEQGHCPADPARNPRCGDRPGVHTVTQPAGPLPLSPPAPLSEASFSPRIRFSSSGTAPHTLPYAGNLGGCKERDGSNLDSSVWLLSLRLFSVSTHAVTCISPSFVFSLRLNIRILTTYHISGAQFSGLSCVPRGCTSFSPRGTPCMRHQLPVPLPLGPCSHTLLCVSGHFL